MDIEVNDIVSIYIKESSQTFKGIVKDKQDHIILVSTINRGTVYLSTNDNRIHIRVVERTININATDRR